MNHCSFVRKESEDSICEHCSGRSNTRLGAELDRDLYRAATGWPKMSSLAQRQRSAEWLSASSELSGDSSVCSRKHRGLHLFTQASQVIIGGGSYKENMYSNLTRRRHVGVNTYTYSSGPLWALLANYINPQEKLDQILTSTKRRKVYSQQRQDPTVHPRQMDSSHPVLGVRVARWLLAVGQ